MTRKRLIGSAPEPYFLEVGLGQIDGVTLDTKFGRNANVGTSFENLNSLGGTYTYSASETNLYLSSSNIGDIDQVVTITYLNGDQDLTTIDVGLSGQSKTLACVDFLRLARAHISAGSDLLGNVYLYEDDTLTGGVPDTATKRRGLIEVDNGQTEMAQFPVPRNCTMAVFDFLLSSGRDFDIQFQARIRPIDQSGPWRVIFDHDVYRSPINSNTVLPKIVSGGFDVEVRARTGAGSAAVSAEWNYILNYNISDSE